MCSAMHRLVWQRSCRGLHSVIQAPKFPCLDRIDQRTKEIEDLGPDPVYSRPKGQQFYYSPQAQHLDFGHTLTNVQVAYETWGKLNRDKSNAILLFTGLSASSHAKSHSLNTAPGWWEKFIGPGASIDTNKFFVVCTNVLGGCYGTTGPSSRAPDDKPYATRFPIITIHDMVRLQRELLLHELGIERLYAAVGSSMGGMQSLAFARDFPDATERVVSISGCARSHPSSIAMRFVQRQILMSDPNWKRGFYYDSVPPHAGLKLAREVATITYRSGPEWEDRFGLDRIDDAKPPALCPDFLIESYLDHQGEKFCLTYDANSLLYISKAMDMFDLGYTNAQLRARTRASKITNSIASTIPDIPYKSLSRDRVRQSNLEDLIEGVKPMAKIPCLVIGVESDTLFPHWQQREIADVLANVGGQVVHRELGLAQSKFGHDTFLLDKERIGAPLKRFLEE